MTTYRVDRPGIPGTETEWFTNATAAETRARELRLTGTKGTDRLTVAWEWVPNEGNRIIQQAEDVA